MQKLNIGIIGAGFIGQLAHLMNFVEIENCNLIALAELRPILRQKVAARFGIPHTYASHIELLNNNDIEAVIVVTPRQLLGPTVLDCLKAKKHVLSEKPMAGSSEQGQRLLDEAKKQQVQYVVGYMKRYDEGVNIAKNALSEALQSDCLGTLLAVHARCYMGNSYCNAYGHITTEEKPHYPLEGWSIAPHWLPERYHQPFSFFVNTYSHVTNLLSYLFRETPSVEFVNLTDHPGQLTVLKFKKFLATLETGKMSHQGWSEEVRIIFSNGEINIFLPPALLRNVPASVEIYRAGKIQEHVRPYVNWTWSFFNQAEAFVNDVLGKKTSRNTAEEALKEIRLHEAIWKAEINRLETSHITNVTRCES